MKTVVLNGRERALICQAFLSLVVGQNGQRGGADLAEQRKAMRIFDILKLDDVIEKLTPEEEEVSAEYKLEDMDYTYLHRVFWDATIWLRTPKVTRQIVSLGDKLEVADKKGEA